MLLQKEGLSELAAPLRRKAVVIHQSVPPIPHRDPPIPHRDPPVRHLLATVLGHLRPEKDPFVPAAALSSLDRDENVRIVHLGRALTAESGREARRWMQRDPRYRWLGEVTHGRALHWLSRSHVLIHPSIMEGGAHVVSEAISAGIPVLASDIPGNVGLLGRRYRGYFPAGDAPALGRLIQRATADPDWLEALTAAVKAQRHLVEPATEVLALRRLIESLDM